MSRTGEPSWASNPVTVTVFPSMDRMRATVAPTALGRYWLRVANTPRRGRVGSWWGWGVELQLVAPGPVQVEQHQDGLSHFQAHQARR